MGALSNYAENNILTHIFRTDSWTKPTVLAVGLLTTIGDDDDTAQYSTGSGVEVANGIGYSRQALNPGNSNWSNPASGTQGQVTNSVDLEFGPASDDWGTVVGCFVATSASYDTGEVIAYGTIDTSKIVSDGDTFRILANGLAISIT